MAIQPQVRFEPVKDQTGLEGVAYVAKWVKYLCAVTGTDDINVCVIPAGTYVKTAIARIKTALNGSGTLDFGYSADEDALIDAADWTETTEDQTATNLGSSNASKPNGVFFADATQLYWTVGGTPTAGEVELLLEVLHIDDMDDHAEVTN